MAWAGKPNHFATLPASGKGLPRWPLFSTLCRNGWRLHAGAGSNCLAVDEPLQAAAVTWGRARYDIPIVPRFGYHCGICEGRLDIAIRM